MSILPAAPAPLRITIAARTISAGNDCTKTGYEMATKSGRAKTRPARPLATALVFMEFSVLAILGKFCGHKLICS